MIRVMSFLLLFLCFSSVEAQKGKLSRTAIDSIRALQTMGEGGKILRFQKSRVDMGAMYESDSARWVSFDFVNSSSQSVRIGRVTTSCGCTSSRFDTVAIPPQGKGRVDIRFSPKGRVGTVDTDAFVYLVGTNSIPDARLVLLGNVIGSDEWEHLPYDMGVLKMKNSKVNFGVITQGQRRVERIACANAGVVPLRLSSVIKPEYITLSTEPVVLQPGEEGDIIISLDATGLPQTNGEQIFRIVVEGVEGRPSQRTIEGVFQIARNKIK